MTTTTVRELRGSFPKIKRLLETEGRVIVTDYGQPKYLITLYTAQTKKAPAAKDYWARLGRFQHQPLAADDAQALHEDNRGDR